MASIASMISLIVVLLATYSYSAPVMSDVQNATLVMETENATTEIYIPNVVILARQETSTDNQEKRGKDKVGLSSSSSEEDATHETQRATESISQRDFEEATHATKRSFGEATHATKRDFEEATHETKRDFEDATVPSTDETNVERETNSEVNESSISTDVERAVTHESFPADAKRAVTHESPIRTDVERAVTHESFPAETNNKRGVEMTSFESSTVIDETSVAPSDQVVQSKRGGAWLSGQTDDETQVAKRGGAWLSGQTEDETQVAKRGGAWLSGQTDDETQVAKRGGSWLSGQTDEETQVAKRSGSWLSPAKRSVAFVESSTDVDENGTVEDSSVPSTSEIINTKRTMGQSSSLTVESSSEFNKRAIGPIESSSEPMDAKRDMDESSSFTTESTDEIHRRAAVSVQSVEAGESSTVVVLNIQPESTTDEQPSSTTVEYVETTEMIGDESSSTSEYETTVVPVDDFTTVSSIPTVSTSKILAIIPGKLTKTQVVVNPVTESPVAMQPVEQVQTIQGQNQSVIEEHQNN